MRANDNTLRRGERKRGFDRNRLPTIADYYQPIFGDLRFNASGWAQVRCVFHEDGHASLSIHRERGARVGRLAMSTPAILEGALFAQAAGFAVHYQRGKRAFEPCWSASPPKIVEELRRDYRDGYNIGFRTGDWSKLDGWPVVVLDADIRGDDPAHREVAREAWRELVGDMKPTVKTGGGGAHLYLRCPPDKLPPDQSIVLRQSQDKVGNKPAWTIELLSGGHAVTLPPSIHPSGQPYEWVNGGLAHVEAMPEALLHAVAAIQQSRPAGTAEADGAWPAPKPIIAELRPVPAFDAETLLPEALRAWIIDEAERMPCPPDFIAAAALVALGSIVGARCAMKPKARDSWLIVPNLWGGIVGDPSAKKSPAWGAALKPLDCLIATALEAHTAALADYETEKVVFDAHKDAIEGRIKEAAKKPGKGDPASIAKELRTHGEQAPEAPTLRRYKTNDSTVEKLGELLRENPAGLLVLRDELVGLIATWEREGREGERAFFLEAWNGNQSFDTDRIGRGHISIPNVCASIFGGIQPDKLTVYLEQAAHALANDGMLQRFQLLVYPDARRWEWRDRAPDKAARGAAFAVFEALADFDPVAWGAAPADDFAKFPHFCFGDEAQAVFIEWSEDMHCGRMPNEDEPIIRQHLAKFDKLFPALALVFHRPRQRAPHAALPHPSRDQEQAQRARHMNRLERARREIPKCARRRTANSAERNLTAVMAVPPPGLWEKLAASIGSNGSTSPSHLLESESVWEAYEERAAIMEFDGGLSRDEAEREAWALVSKRYRLH